MRVINKSCLVLLIFVLLSFSVLAGDYFSLQGNVDNSDSTKLSSGGLVVEIWDGPDVAGSTLIYNSTDNFTGSGNISSGKFDIVLGNALDQDQLNLEYGRIYYMDLFVAGENMNFSGNERQPFMSSIGTINSSFLNASNDYTMGSLTITNITAATLLLNVSHGTDMIIVNSTGIGLGSGLLYVDPITSRVGIGTTSPGTTLDVRGWGISLWSGGATTQAAYSIGRTANEGYFGVAGAASNFVTGSAAGDIILTAGSSGNLLLGTGASDGAPGTIRLIILNGGSVGIGTTTPSMLLDVNGDANLTGTTYIGNSTLYVSGSSVGIGTTTPSNTLNVIGDLNVTGSSYLGNLSFSDNATFIDSVNISENFEAGGTLFVNERYGTVTIDASSLTIGGWGQNSLTMEGWMMSLAGHQGVSVTSNAHGLSFSVGETSDPRFIWKFGATELITMGQNGNLGIGTSSATRLLHLVKSENNETVTDLLSLDLVNASGDVGNGFGPGMMFRSVDDTGEMENVSMIAGVMSNFSNGSETGDIVFYTGYADENGQISNLSSSEALRIKGGASGNKVVIGDGQIRISHPSVSTDYAIFQMLSNMVSISSYKYNDNPYTLHLGGSTINFGMGTGSTTMYYDSVSLYPYDNSVLDLGRTSQRWDDGYIDKVYSHSLRIENTSSAVSNAYLNISDGTNQWLLIEPDGDMLVKQNVGIGTTTPSNTLNVVGDLNVTGSSYLGNLSFTDNATFIDSVNISEHLEADGVLFTNGRDKNVEIVAPVKITYGQHPSDFILFAVKGAQSDWPLQVDSMNGVQNGASVTTNDLRVAGSLSVGTSTMVNQFSGGGVLGFKEISGTATRLTSDWVLAWAEDYAAGDARLRILSESGNQIIMGNNELQLYNAADADGTFTNYERGSIKWGSNTFNINTDYAGNGTGRNININDTLYVTNESRVGIGTSTPSMILDVNGDANLTGTTYIGNSTLYVDGSSVGIGTTGPTEKSHTAGAIVSTGASANWCAGDAGALLQWHSNAAMIAAKPGSTPGLSTSIQFHTANSGCSTGARMTIDNVGNVGIGTTAPTALLHVENTSAAVSNAYLNISDGANQWLLVEPDGDLLVKQKVGIGTTNPGANLEVLGSGGSQLLNVTNGSDTAFLVNDTGVYVFPDTVNGIPAGGGADGPALWIYGYQSGTAPKWGKLYVDSSNGELQVMGQTAIKIGVADTAVLHIWSTIIRPTVEFNINDNTKFSFGGSYDSDIKWEETTNDALLWGLPDAGGTSGRRALVFMDQANEQASTDVRSLIGDPEQNQLSLLNQGANSSLNIRFKDENPYISIAGDDVHAININDTLYINTSSGQVIIGGYEAIQNSSMKLTITGGDLNVSGAVFSQGLVLSSPFVVQSAEGEPIPMCMKNSAGVWVGCMPDENNNWQCEHNQECDEKVLGLETTWELKSKGLSNEEVDKKVGLLKQKFEQGKTLQAIKDEIRAEVGEMSVLNELDDSKPKFSVQSSDNSALASEVNNLRSENDLLKSELCKKDNTYSWCKAEDKKSEQKTSEETARPEGQPTTPTKNNAPVIESFKPETVPIMSIGESQEFTIAASDADKDALSLQWFVNNVAVSEQVSNSFTFDAEDVGSFVVKVLVTDSKDYVTKEWDLTVSDAASQNAITGSVVSVPRSNKSLLDWIRSLFN